MPEFDIEMMRKAAEAITDALRELLEKKHLYQSVIVSREKLDRCKAKMVSDMIIAARSQPLSSYSTTRPSDVPKQCDASIQTVLEAEWLPFAGTQSAVIQVTFMLPTIHTFCPTCEKLWPFNPNPQQGFSTVVPQSMFFLPIEKCQVWVLPYQCQSCKDEPLVFLVRREGMKLTLCGRSIIESLPVPKSLPKSVAKSYADAHIAHNAGQTLAGLFLLRTFIEQFWRERIQSGVLEIPNKDSRLHADELAKAYNAILPEDFKNRFPSLGKIYDQISDCLHNATPDGEVFAKAANNILEHFDARRLFKQDAEEERRVKKPDEKKVRVANRSPNDQTLR
jgi:hypothetical protein